MKDRQEWVCLDLVARLGSQNWVITILKKAEDIPKLIKSSASGFLLVNEDFDELINAIKVVKLGENYYSPKVAKAMVKNINTKHVSLTPSETKVFILLNEKKSRKKVAEELKICRSTLRAHIRNIRAKLGPNAV